MCPGCTMSKHPWHCTTVRPSARACTRSCNRRLSVQTLDAFTAFAMPTISAPSLRPREHLWDARRIDFPPTKPHHPPMVIQWNGVFPAVTTQFRSDQSLDLAATERHLHALIDSGVTGLVMLGSLGENVQ